MRRPKRARDYAVLPGGGVEVLMTAVHGDVELSGPEALANRPDNSFELRWVTADQFAELGLHPPDLRGPLAALLTSRTDPV